MTRRLVLVGVAVATLGCGSSVSEPAKAANQTKAATADAFLGSWNSVTPSYDFIRLSVASLSIQQGALGARLTLSGVALDGSARIDADSLIATLSVGGSSETNAILGREYAYSTTTFGRRNSAQPHIRKTMNFGSTIALSTSLIASVSERRACFVTLVTTELQEKQVLRPRSLP